ncbi:MAG: DUF3256 family protein [Bacteroidaceae bacterium]|nr:DUF3256 family protein [Bacteroidaceae bacterium]
MKTKITIIVCLILLSNFQLRAESIDSIFANLRVCELSLLTKNDRLDLLDYANCGQEASVENSCYGRTKLTKKLDDYIHLSMTEVNDVEFFLLPYLNNDTVVCIVSTLNSPLEESKIRCYTLQGRELTAPYRVPVLQDFLENESAIPPGVVLPIKMVYDVNDRIFEFEISLKHLSIDQQKKYSNKFSKVTYQWSEGGFVRKE